MDRFSSTDNYMGESWFLKNIIGGRRALGGSRACLGLGYRGLEVPVSS